MDPSLDSVIEAARLRLAAVTPEVAGYMVLLAARELENRPVRISPSGVFLSETGQVHVRAAASASDAVAEASLRQLLGTLLALSPSPALVLAAVAQRPPEATLRGLSAELAGALIPINHAAAQRALARLYRETLRAQGIAGQLIERAEHTDGAGHTGDDETALPPRVAPVALASRDEVPPGVSRDLAPGAGVPASAEPAPAPVPVLPDEIDVDIDVEPEPFAADDPEVPAIAVESELPSAPPPASSLRDDPLEAGPSPVLDAGAPVVEALVAAPLEDHPREAEPELLGAASPSRGVDPDARFDGSPDAIERFDTSEEPPRTAAADDAASEAPLPPPVVARPGAWGADEHPIAAPEVVAEATPSGPRSDVDALLSVFLQHTKSDEQITRALRALVGLERHSKQANGIRKPRVANAPIG